MASPRLGAGLEIVSDSMIKHPPVAKVYSKAPSVGDLDAMELPTYGLTHADLTNESATTNTSKVNNASPPRTPDELEQSQPPTPQREGAASIMPTFWFPKMNKYRVLSACGEYFANGLNDSAPGALIPYIESWYSIGYAVVSMIWISNAVGQSCLPFKLYFYQVFTILQVSSSQRSSRTLSARSLVVPKLSCFQKSQSLRLMQ